MMYSYIAINQDKIKWPFELDTISGLAILVNQDDNSVTEFWGNKVIRTIDSLINVYFTRLKLVLNLKKCSYINNNSLKLTVAGHIYLC